MYVCNSQVAISNSFLVLLFRSQNDSCRFVPKRRISDSELGLDLHPEMKQKENAARESGSKDDQCFSAKLAMTFAGSYCLAAYGWPNFTSVSLSRF